jgi:NADH dehydrogenase FAD-containing subunit
VGIKSFFDKIFSKSKHVLKKIMDTVSKKSKKKSRYDALSTAIGSPLKNIPNKEERTFTMNQLEEAELRNVMKAQMSLFEQNVQKSGTTTLVQQSGSTAV